MTDWLLWPENFPREWIASLLASFAAVWSYGAYLEWKVSKMFSVERKESDDQG